MASGADARFGRVTIVVAVLSLNVAAVATERARDAARREASSDRTGTRPPTYPASSLDRIGPFWIGAWCPPPARATTAEAWTRFADAGIDLGIYPLEDRYRREDNLARLALLDSLNRTRPPGRHIFTIVRDDSVHPDETLRPGWEGRLERARTLYARYASCAGMFLADEPPIDAVPFYAPIARAAEADSPSILPGMFVNFMGLPGHPTVGDRPRWRHELTHALRESQLRFFTVDSYAARGPGGEWPNFLLTLEDAARVAWTEGSRFGVLIQVTGHGHFDPATPAEARVRVYEALAHGATAIVWFTYWTPNPTETPWLWHDGLVEYATGEPTAQYAMVQAVNTEARRCAAWWRPSVATGVAHLGGELPAGADAIAARGDGGVPGLTAVSGGPITVAYAAASEGRRKLLLVNRDVENERVFELSFDPVVSLIGPVAFDGVSDRFAWGGSGVALRLPPGGAIGLELHLVPEERTAGRP